MLEKKSKKFYVGTWRLVIELSGGSRWRRILVGNPRGGLSGFKTTVRSTGAQEPQKGSFHEVYVPAGSWGLLLDW